MFKSRVLEAFVLTAALGISICASGIVVAGAAPAIKIDGSSTMYPITDRMAKNFQEAKKEPVGITVDVSGTGSGFAKFCRGEIDIANASRPIRRKEMKACDKAGVGYIELPVAFDAVTVVINPENNWSKAMTVAELKQIWEPAAQGRITRWNQVNPAWPAEAFKLYATGPGSGTFDFFTQAIMGKAKSSRGDFTASGEDDVNVVIQGVAADKNALGFLGFGYYAENKDKIKAVAIDNDSGEAIMPSVETVENGTYQPLSRPIFIYVSAKAAEKPGVREFVEFYMKNGSALARGAHYFPLPPRAYRRIMEIFKTRRLGTVFDGFLPESLTIDDLLKREARFYEN
jgi:phosphate transport system substrate-binding protein